MGMQFMEDPIVIPTAKSVQLTLQRGAHRNEQANSLVVVPDVANGNGGGVRVRSGGRAAVKLLQAEVNQKIADWQNELCKQSSLISTLEELLKADLEALKAGKPPPEDNEDQRKVLSASSPKVAVQNASPHDASVIRVN